MIASLSKHQQLTDRSNIIRLRKEKQHWNEINCMPIDYIQRFPDVWFRKLSKIEKKILDFLLHVTFNKRYEYIYIRQDTLAAFVGCSREWVNKVLLKFEKLGLIVSNYRHMTSCLYKVSRYFNIPAIQSKLSFFFKSLRSLKRYLFTQLGIREIKDNNNREKSSKVLRMEDIINHDILMGRHPITPIIKNINREIPELSLSPSGQVDLCAFPDEVIEHAVKITKWALKTHLPSESAWGYFFKVCLNRCEELGVSPDWKWSYEIRKLYNISKDETGQLEAEDQSYEGDRLFVKNLKNPPKESIKAPELKVVKVAAPVSIQSLTDEQRKEKRESLQNSSFFKMLSVQAQEKLMQALR